MSKADEDSRDVSEMVLAAKNGEWSKVFGIVHRKPYLINCIPEERAWGALHQSAWWSNEEAVTKLLAYPNCDSEIKTKQDRANESGPGKTPLWIAEYVRPNAQIASILEQNFKNERQKRFGGTIPTYVTSQDGEKMDRDGLPLLILTLANYKKTFHPEAVSPHVAFKELMNEMFKYTADSLHWRVAMEKVSFSLGAFDKNAADFLSTDVVFRNTTDEQRFFARTVKLYSSNHIYRQVNESLRREGQGRSYKPTADDLALGPYTLSLDVLLFYWKELNPVRTPTFRVMNLSSSDLQMYTVGTKFIWLSFVSSSKKKQAALDFPYEYNTLFEISNDKPDAVLWQPRDLSHSFHDLSEYSHEEEALYPAGAEFQVTANNPCNERRATRRITLKLMKAA